MISKKTAPAPKKAAPQTKTDKNTKSKQSAPKNSDQKTNNGFSEHVRRLVLIFVVAAVIFSIIYFLKPQKPVLQNPDYNIGMAAGIIYRHTVAYKHFCSQNGYELKQYPENFTKYMKNDIDKIETNANANGYSLKQLYKHIEEQGVDKVSQSVVEDMENFRKNAIIWLAANHYNVSPDKIQWSDEMKELMSMHDACALFDDFSSQYDFSKTNGYKVIKKAVKNLK